MQFSSIPGSFLNSVRDGLLLIFMSLLVKTLEWQSFFLWD